MPDFLEPLWSQERGHQVDEQQQSDNGGEQQHECPFSDFFATNDESAHEPQPHKPQEQQPRNPDFEIHKLFPFFSAQLVGSF